MGPYIHQPQGRYKHKYRFKLTVICIRLQTVLKTNQISVEMGGTIFKNGHWLKLNSSLMMNNTI